MKEELPAPVRVMVRGLAWYLLWPRAAQSSLSLAGGGLQPCLTRSLLDRLTTCVCRVEGDTAVVDVAGAACAAIGASRAAPVPASSAPRMVTALRTLRVKRISPVRSGRCQPVT